MGPRKAQGVRIEMGDAPRTASPVAVPTPHTDPSPPLRPETGRRGLTPLVGVFSGPPRALPIPKKIPGKSKGKCFKRPSLLGEESPFFAANRLFPLALSGLFCYHPFVCSECHFILISERRDSSALPQEPCRSSLVRRKLGGRRSGILGGAIAPPRMGGRGRSFPISGPLRGAPSRPRRGPAPLRR